MAGNHLSIGRPGSLTTAPGRNVRALVSAGRGRGRGRAAADQQQPEEGAAKPPPPPPRRLSKLFEKYQDADEQKLEVDNYKAERENAVASVPSARDGRPRARVTKASEYVKGSVEAAKKRAKMFFFNPERNEDEANIGVYGQGKMTWWALRVNPGREKQVADAIDRLLEYLPPLRINGQDKPGIPREAECWVPAKKVRAWSPKTGKLGNKSLKYDDGGFILVKTIMDKAFVTMMAGNINVLGFQDREVYEGVEFPRPASAELLKIVRDWEADLSDISEDQVKAQLGLDNVVLPATSEPSLEEFFYDEDVEASLAAVEEREARRGERGGRFGARGRFGGGREERGRRGRGERGGRGGRSGFFPADNDSYDSRRRNDSRSNNRSEDGGWDRPPRRQQRDDTFSSSTSGTGIGGAPGGDWYEGGSSDVNDGSSGWFTGTTSNFNDAAVDDDIGWFGADTAYTSAGTDSNNATSNTKGSRGDTGGLLSDDDDEFWSPAPPSSGQSSVEKKSPPIDDDLDAIWGAGMGGGDIDLGGGWMNSVSQNNEKSAAPFSGRGAGAGAARGGAGGWEREERGGRGRFENRSSDRGRGRGGDRFERGAPRGRGRGGSFDEGGFSDSRRSYTRDRNDEPRDNDRFSGGDDLSWWDAPSGDVTSTAAQQSTEAAATSSDSTAAFSKGGGGGGAAAPRKENQSSIKDGDDWFSDDFDFSSSTKKGSGNAPNDTPDAPSGAPPPPLSAGTKVEVVSGRFQDFEGVIVESKGERVKAELDVFGTPTVVEISRGEVEPF